MESGRTGNHLELHQKPKLCTELLVRFPWFSHLKTLPVSLGYQTDGTLSVEPDPGLALDVQVGSMRR